MSVINKMLRDLDARRAEGAAPSHPRQSSPSGMQGTASVPPPAQPPVARLGRWLLLFLLLAASIAMAWFLGLGMSSLPAVAPPLAVVVEPPASAPVPSASAPESAASAPEEMAGIASETRPAATPEPPVVRRKNMQTGLSSTGTPAAIAAEKKEMKGRTHVTAPADTLSSVAGKPAGSAVAPLPALVASASAPAAKPLPQRRQAAAQEALAQAQAQWKAGSREAALELLRDAVAAVERAQPVDVTLLAQLASEQSRMELALGRPAAVLALLGRLEPVLSGQADLWAVRGNAAQRLGRHQESVQAYLAALQLRPGEPRWMLGAAVSLAALGKLEAAAQQAEQARALGPVNPEVLTYLRQAGVPLR